MVKFRKTKPVDKGKIKKPKAKTILVTSALPYANGSIHLGHLVEYIQTDIFVRFLKLSGENAVYICADDTHGAPIEIKASELGISPEQLIDKFFREHKKDFDDFLIKFDSYHTTNSPENKHYSDLIFERLRETVMIYTKEMEVTYCGNCKRYLPDRYVKGKCPKCNAPDQYGDVCESCNSTHKTTELKEPYCIICRHPPERKNSMHYFFRLSSFSERLDEWLKQNDTLQPEIKNFIFNWIKSGLDDWNISRDGPYFGFKIPGEENKYYYVWLDAPIGYIASTENYCKLNSIKFNCWNSKSTRIIHFIGKDIIYFHFLFWPAMLMGAGFSLPETIVVHGFLTVNGEKMSKSRGTFFTAREFLSKYNPEYLRYYYASIISRKLADIDLNLDNFREKINKDLADNIGNFCHRVVSFLNSNFDGKIAEIDDDSSIIGEIQSRADSIAENYRKINFNEAVRDIMHVSSLGNKYFQDNQPWKLVKGDKEKTHRILGLSANIVKNLSIIIQPILPNFSEKLQQQLNLKNLKWKDINFKLKNHKIGNGEILFRKIEDEQKKVFQLNLKVARILEVKEHPNADKLYVIQIDLGSEKRQLVAGLRGHYSIEELNGKKVVVITNLKYAKLRGIESQGMLLAGDDGSSVGLLTAKESSAGDSVFIEGYENSNEELTFEQFQKISITTANSHAVYEGKELKTAKEKIIAEKVKDGAKVR